MTTICIYANFAYTGAKVNFTLCSHVGFRVVVMFGENCCKDRVTLFGNNIIGNKDEWTFQI